MIPKYKLTILDTSDPYSHEPRAYAEFDGLTDLGDIWQFADLQIARLETAYPAGTYEPRLFETRQDVEVPRPS